VDVTLTEDQRMLQDATRRYLEDRSPIGTLRRLADNSAVLSDEAWRDGVAQGWLSLFIPEALGGMAESVQGVIDAAILAEELGRVVYPGPFLSNCVVAFALGQSGSPAQQSALLPGLAEGEKRAAWCFAASSVKVGIEPGGVRVARTAAGSSAGNSGGRQRCRTVPGPGDDAWHYCPPTGNA
jgi:alkylation response protein AidB-like acyl-CoA dehydrogenase